MNWNGQRPYIDHFIHTRSNPALAGALQADLNSRRRKRLYDACLTRPVYLTLRYEMTAAGVVPPYRDTTPTLGYDVLIIGAKSDVQDRDIIIRSTESERSLVKVGGSDNVYLRADEFAGQIPGNGGQTGIQYFPTPILLPQGRRITGEMFKTDTTGADEVANIVLVGIRVLDKAYAESVIAAEAPLIEQALRQREMPEKFYQKITFDFDSAIAGGKASNILTHRVDEPTLIRGIRTSLRHSLIELGFSGDVPWTSEQTPIWAVAGEDEIGNDNWIWMPKPLYLRKHAQVEIHRVENGINDADLDSETGNTITFICETV